jgi:DNA-binding beta-propeller fold protein YncE
MGSPVTRIVPRLRMDRRRKGRAVSKLRTHGLRAWTVVRVLCAFVVLTSSVLAAPASGSASVDLRGSWHTSGEFAQTQEITAIDLETGHFSGRGFAQDGSSETWPVSGTISGSSVTLVAGPYDHLPSYSSTFTGTLSSDGKAMAGEVNDSSGHHFASWTMVREPTGALSQLSSPFNCVSETESPVAVGCGTLVPFGLNAAYEAQVSPDGRNVYSVAISGDLVEYSRNAATGALAVIGCITSSTEACASTNATTGAFVMAAPAAIAVSPDGNSAYVVTQGENNLVEFSRNHESGLLTEIGCISRQDTQCAAHEVKGLNNPYGVTVSPDGKNVYVASYSDEAVAELARNAETGVLEQLAPPNNCISSAALSECGITNAIGLERAVGVIASPDGKNLYVAAGATNGAGAVASFQRESGTGALKQLPGSEACISEANHACLFGAAIDGPEDLVISPDGENVYTNSSQDNAVIELTRNVLTGGLTQVATPNACVTTNMTEQTAHCSSAKGIGVALGLAISPGGEDVYASSASEAGEAAFERNPETGVLEQLKDPYECVTSNSSGCGGAGNLPEFNKLVGLEGARRVTVSPDGANLYLAGQNAHTIVELSRVRKPARIEPPPVANTTVILAPAPVIPILTGVPPPRLAKTGNVAPVAGKVLVRLPGTKTFVPLASLRQIPFGTVIEATHGTVSVTTANPNGTTQTGQFFGGQFVLTQGKNGQVLATLSGGNFSVCPTARERAHIARAGSVYAEAAASGKHVVRKLWANAHGKFSTKGNYAAGAVQGTEWLTEDLCEGTLIRVRRDKVAVTNLVKHKHVEVKTGHKYLAKAP